jgi:hypothetical protein
MIFYILLFLFILSLEATVALPVFFIYLVYQFLLRQRESVRILALFLISLSLAVFYSVSWPLITFLLVLYHLCYQKLFVNVFWQLLGLVCLQGLIFFIAHLQLNFFYLLQILLFAFYFYKTNLKRYAC